MTFPTLSRRIFTAAVLCSAAFTAGAQDKYPSKPITLVVPQAAGGANDAIARVVAQKLGEQLGQSVIVENRPGAGGTLATGTTARARNDGYTLLLTADSAHVIGPALYKNPGFDPVKDFAPVAPCGHGRLCAGGAPIVPCQHRGRDGGPGQGQPR